MKILKNKKKWLFLLPFGIFLILLVKFWEKINQDLKVYTGFNIRTILPKIMTLAQKNNNPLNLRFNSIGWVGEVGSFGGFSVFDNTEHGARAGLKNLINMSFLYGVKTIEGKILRHAPKSDGNDPEAYIAHVIATFKLNGKVVTRDYEVATKQDYSILAQSMSSMESGSNDLTVAFFEKCYDMI